MHSGCHVRCSRIAVRGVGLHQIGVDNIFFMQHETQVRKESSKIRVAEMMKLKLSGVAMKTLVSFNSKILGLCTCC